MKNLIKTVKNLPGWSDVEPRGVVLSFDNVELATGAAGAFLFNKFWKKFFKLVLSGWFGLLLRAVALCGVLIVGTVAAFEMLCWEIDTKSSWISKWFIKELLD